MRWQRSEVEGVHPQPQGCGGDRKLSRPQSGGGRRGCRLHSGAWTPTLVTPHLGHMPCLPRSRPDKQSPTGPLRPLTYVGTSCFSYDCSDS